MQTFLEGKKIALDKQLDQNSVLAKLPQSQVEVTDRLVRQGDASLSTAFRPLTHQAVTYTADQAASFQQPVSDIGQCDSSRYADLSSEWRLSD